MTEHGGGREGHHMNMPHAADYIEIKKPTLANAAIFFSIVGMFVTILVGGVRIIDKVDRINENAVTKPELAQGQTDLINRIEGIAPSRAQSLVGYKEEREQNRDARESVAKNAFDIEALKKEDAAAEAKREATNQ